MGKSVRLDNRPLDYHIFPSIIFSTIHENRCLCKDKAFTLLFVRDKSKALSEDNNLKQSPTPLCLFMDPANLKLGLLARFVSKYSKQDFQ